MKCLTQTCLDPGNCLQTVLACILHVRIAEVPTQVEDLGGYLAYLDSYLKDKGLRLEVADPGEDLCGHRLAYLEHVMCGVMRGPLGGQCEEHCVVGRNGRMVWDPYPTRPGLIRVDWHGLLVLR